MMRPASGYGSGRSSTPLMTLKMAVLAPMPSPSVRMKASEYPAVRGSVRNARRMSLNMGGSLVDARQQKIYACRLRRATAFSSLRSSRASADRQSKPRMTRIHADLFLETRDAHGSRHAPPVPASGRPLEVKGSEETRARRIQRLSFPRILSPPGRAKPGPTAAARDRTNPRCPRDLRLNRADLHRTLQLRERIVPLARRVLVRHEACVAEIGDRFHHEVVVQLLRVVDLVPAGVAARVEVADPLEVVTDVAGDVAVHDLRVVDVEEDLHPRRVDALHDVHAPRDVVEDVVLVVHLA